MRVWKLKIHIHCKENAGVKGRIKLLGLPGRWLEKSDCEQGLNYITTSVRTVAAYI
jgi:hypothetical protein